MDTVAEKIIVIGKTTGKSTELPFGDIPLNTASVVKVPVTPSEVTAVYRTGNDLVLQLISGDVITIKDFFIVHDDVRNEIVFEGEDGVLWWGQYDPDFAGFTFTELSTVDELLVLAQSGGMAGWLLGGLGLAGLGALALGGSSSRDNSESVGGPIGNEPDPGEPVDGGTGNDSEPPAMPANLSINPQGTMLTGTGEPGATVTVRNQHNQVVGSGTVDDAGNFSVVLTPPQTDGGALSVTLTDTAGNTSSAGSVDTPDLTAPAEPANLTVSPDGTTLSGNGEAGAVVEVRNAADEIVGTGTVQEDGTFSITLNPVQVDGGVLSVTLTDAAGNTSSAGSINTPDLTAPAEPANLTVSPDGTTLSGNGEAGATVEVRNAANDVVGTGTVQEDGSFTVTLSPAQVDGTALSVTLTDAAGNTSVAVAIATPDLIPPATAENLQLHDDGSTLTGTGEAGVTVTVRDAANTVVGSGTVQADGTFSVTLIPPQRDGGELSVVLTDASDNDSDVATIQTQDLITIAAPDNLVINADGTELTGTGEVNAIVTVRNAANTVVGTGTVQADGTFSVILIPPQIDGEVLRVSLENDAGGYSATGEITAPDLTAPEAPDNLDISADGSTLIGTGEAGATVEVRNVADEVVGSGTVQPDGTFSVTLSPVQEDGNLLSVTLTDTAGNHSAAGTITAPDLVAPDMPQDLQISADGSSLSGTGEAGAVVEVRNAADEVVGTGTVQPDGTFSVTLSPVQEDGNLLSVTLTDVAGNASDAGSIASPDLIAPDMPQNLSINAAGTSISGEGELGALVKVYNAAGDQVGIGMVGPDGSFTVSLSPAQGDSGVLRVTLTDAADNESVSAQINAPDLIPPAIPDNLQVSPDGQLLSGTGEAGATVTVRNAADEIVGTGTVLGDGTFEITLSPVQNNGDQLSVTLTDAAGNHSAAGTITAPDLVAPDMPQDLQISADGSSLSGTGEAGATVEVRNAADEVVGSGTVQPDGSFSIVLSPAQGDSGELTITLTDAAGNASVPGTVTAPDLLPPAMPEDLQVSADGSSLSGTGEAGAMVEVRNAADEIVGTGTVQPDGTFSVTLSPVQEDGNLLSVTLTDAAGNVSDAGNIASPDLIAPEIPLDLQLNADGSSLSGTGEAGATVTVRNAADEIVGTGTVLGDGTFEITLSPVQNNGDQLSVTLTDAAGNHSAAGTITAPDLVAPDAPQDLQISADGSSLSGTGEVGAVVEVRNAADEVVGSGTVQPDGSFSIVLSPAQGDSGELTITLTDAAGNASVPGTVTAPDLLPPAVPQDLQVSADGSSLSGTGEAGATVTVRNAADEIVGTGTVQLDGTFSVTLSPVQEDGNLLSVTLTDAAGNVSDTGNIASPDLIAPEIPLDLQVNAAGTVLTGSGEAGATVEVRNAADEVVGSGTVQPDGSFSINLSPVQGDSGILSVTLTDAAGNTSIAGTVSAPDLIPPAMPEDLQVSADGSNLSGTGEIGATVTVRNAGNHIVGTGTVQADGSFAVTLNPPQVDGGALNVVLTDAAGNISAPGTVTVPDLIEIPAPVNLVVDATGDTLTGEGEPETLVTVWNADGQLVGSGTVGLDGQFTITLVPPQIDGNTLEVILSDGAGKYSEPGTVLTPDLTPPEIPLNLQLNADGSVLTGTGEPGAVAEVRNAADQVVGTGTVLPDGSFSISLVPPQQDGAPLQIRLTDPAGNTSGAGSVNAPDLIAPDTPVNLQVSADGLNITGNGEAGAIVTVRDAADQIVGTGTVLPDGSFSVSLSPVQNDGSALQVTLTDAAGNISAAGSVFSPDLIPPAAPENLQVSADGLSLSGTGEAGATVTVRDAANQIVGTGLVQPDGSFTVTLTSVQGDSGLLSVMLTDAAGNQSDADTVTAPDLIPPAMPDNLSVNAPGTELTGEGEPGATVTVYNADNQEIGTGTVGENGLFTISLNPAQDSGGVLSVVLSDASGNLSAPGVVSAPVVVDIEAFDNEATAKVNILPTETHSSAGSADYTLLLGLLGSINLQLLSTPSIGFSVADGNTGQITLTLDTVLAIDALGDHRIVLQVKNGEQWEAVTGAGQASFLNIELLADNAKGVMVNGLPAGEYRAFVVVNSLIGLSLATTLTGELLQADYANPQGYDNIEVSGNVLSDINDGLQQDLITADTVVSHVNQTSIAASGDTVIEGLYGQLTIDAAGNYTYTPNSDPAVIGKSEQFEYTITDTATGRQSTAKLYVRIDSDQVDLTWETPGQDADLQFSAGDNSAVAAIVYKNVVDEPATDFLGSFTTSGGLAGSGSGQFTFTVDANDVSNTVIYVGSTANLSLLPTFSIVLEQSNGSGGWVAVPGGSASGLGLLGLPLVGTGLSLSVNGLTEGTYRISVNTTNILGNSFLSSVQVVQTITHLDQYTADINPGVSGNILADDELGSSFTRLFVKDSGGVYQEVSYDGVSITGSYGVLNINKYGDYVYTPNGNQHHSADVTEIFEYQLRHPGGEIVTARLEIQLEVSGAGVVTGMEPFMAEIPYSADSEQDPQLTEPDNLHGLLSHEVSSFDFEAFSRTYGSFPAGEPESGKIMLEDILSKESPANLYLNSGDGQPLIYNGSYASDVTGYDTARYINEWREEDRYNQINMAIV
ncbi:Ig-like domain-containing protein [Chromatiaceae bacterium AAb-1]|nr:Ig-like domain-containing protein [Chromatiaceae bacterium AAb-1]